MKHSSAGWMMMAALALTACGALPYNHTNQVAATQASHSVQFAHNAVALSLQEDDLLREFLSGLPPLATEEIVVEGKLPQKHTQERLAGIRLALLQQHFPREAINVVNSPDLPDDIITLTITTGHVLPPVECPDWSDWSVNNFNNHTYSNFGCATTSNLGQQVAHPYDLLHGTESNDGPDGERNNVAIGLWRANAIPPADPSGGGQSQSSASGTGSASGGASSGQ